MADEPGKRTGGVTPERAEEIRKQLQEIFDAMGRLDDEVHRRGGEPTEQDLERRRIYEQMRDELVNELHQGEPDGPASDEDAFTGEELDAIEREERLRQEANSSLTGEELDYLDRLKRNRDKLTGEELDELDRLQRILDNAPDPDMDGGASSSGGGGDMGGGESGDGQAGGVEAGGTDGDGDDGADDGGMSGSGSGGGDDGGEMPEGDTPDSGDQMLSEGDDTVGRGPRKLPTRIGGLRGLGQALRQSLFRRRLHGRTYPADDGSVPTGPEATLPSRPGRAPTGRGPVVDPVPDDSRAGRIVPPEAVDRVRRPGSDPRVTDPSPDDDDL